MKKDVKKIMLIAKYKNLHFSALEKCDYKKAQEYLDLIDGLEKTTV